MITYTYVVKCPNCDEEFFDIFDEAKAFALGCLSQKPVITQTEVNRNDFGECTDHCDLGTVWSWEDAVGKTDDEPAKSVFTKDDLKAYIPDEDPEFTALDNSVDYEIDEVSETPTIERKPVPEGMSLKELVEAMEENEDTVECAGCEELFPKDECFQKEGIGWLCGDCEDRIVKCGWCEELFDRDECRYEADLKWLCSRCEAGIKSRGETLTFREGNYWDFLDEELTEELSFADTVKDSINHLVNDLGKDPLADDFADDVIGDLERNYTNFVPEEFSKYQEWCSAVACEVSRQINGQLTEATAISDSDAIGRYVKLVNHGAPFAEDGSDWNLLTLKKEFKTSHNTDIPLNRISFIVKYDNKCKIIQETSKAYLVKVPCYFRNAQDRTKIEEHPNYYRCWVNKTNTEFIDEEK